MIKIKSSIRFKFVFLFTAILAIMTVSLLIANLTLLQKYYEKKNIKKLNKIASSIILDYQKVNFFDQQYLYQLEDNYNIRVTIAPLNTPARQEGSMHKMMSRFNPTPSFLANLTQKEKELLNSGKKVVQILKPNRFRGFFIVLAYKIPNEERLIILYSPIAQIKEAVSSASEFLLIASSITLLLGSIAVYFSSRTISNPIIKINSIAKSMASLDFSKNISIKSSDEIEELGNSINFLSAELESKITALNSANQKLVKEIEKEREIEKMRRVFISNISHELKTPIAVIGGYAEALNDNIVHSKESRQFYLETILKESEKMAKIVNELLLLSKLESPAYTMDFNFFNISDCVEDILINFDLHLNKKQVTVEKKYPSNLEVFGNREKIESCIENFLSNAISFVNENGMIRVEIEKTNNSVVFKIFNSGEKIPDDKLENIWLAFTKADEARTRELGGSGLGLSIVKSIIDKHNGKYGCSNLENEVLFWFELFNPNS